MTTTSPASWPSRSWNRPRAVWPESRPACEPGDSGDLAAEAHGLKGISRTIGADDLADALRELEDVGATG